MGKRRRWILWATAALMALLLFAWAGGWAELWLRSALYHRLGGAPEASSRTGLGGKLSQWSAQAERSRTERERQRQADLALYWARWPRDRASDCAAFDRGGNGPALCIRRLDASSYPKGGRIEALVEWRNMPPGAQLMMHVWHDSPPGPEFEYAGWDGPMEMRPRPLAPSGSMLFSWPGKGFPCAPADAPMICDEPLEVGRYRLRARAHASGHLAGATGLVVHREPEPELIAHASSAPFTVDGEPDLSGAARAIGWAATDRFMGSGTISQSSYLQVDLTDGGLDVRERLGRYCARIGARPPYRSSLEGCIPRRDVRDSIGIRRHIDKSLVVFTGGLSPMPEAMPEDAAFAIARAAAGRPYVGRYPARPEGEHRCAAIRDSDSYRKCMEGPANLPYLSFDLGERFYRPDLGGAWLIEVKVMLAGGSAVARRAFGDLFHRVLVRVERSGRACVVETRPNVHSSFAADLQTARIECP